MINWEKSSFYKSKLDLEIDQSALEKQSCFSLNFGIYIQELKIPQISLTPESNIKLNFDSDNMNTAISCYIVLVGGKYLNDIKDVMTKVDSVKVVVGVRPQAIFIQSNNYSENLDIDMKTITTVMVRTSSKPMCCVLTLF